MNTLMLAAVALAGPVQSSDLNEVLLLPGDTLITPAGPKEVLNFGGPIAGLDGGWITGATLESPSGISRALVGQPAGALNGPIVVFRENSTVGGVVQLFVGAPSMWNGQFAYVASQAGSSGTIGSAWLDDQMLYEEGDSLPGTSLVWSQFRNTFITTSGTVLIDGGLTEAGGGIAQRALVEWPGGQIRLISGGHLTGIPQAVNGLSDFSVSPNGSHVAATATVEVSARRAIVLDGDVLTFSTGEIAFGRRTVPASIGAAVGMTAKWDGVGGPRVNDAGDLAFFGVLDSSSGTVVVRNELPVQGPASFGPLVGMDRDGATLTRSFIGLRAAIENAPVMGLNAPIDVDRDGAADPGWEFRFSAVPVFAGANPDAPTVFSTNLMTPAGTGIFGIVAARPFRIDAPVCEGVANSTGRAGQLVASGSRHASGNDFTLQAFQLPPGASGYFLMSESSGLTVQPGNSQGNLCLGGSIGRLAHQIFAAGPGGTGLATVDLAAIPQPMGSAQVLAGETWFAQTWHRDSVGGVSTSNFTSAVSVTFD